MESNTTIINATLPKDPTDGLIYTAPKGGSIGGSTVIYITTTKNDVLGTTQQLIPIPNVCKKYTITRTTSKRCLKKNDIVNIVAKQYTYNTMVFLNYYGWVGHSTKDKPVTLETATYRIHHVIPIGDTTQGYYQYEKICLERITKE